MKSGSHGEVKLFTFIGGRFTHFACSGRYESEDVRSVRRIEIRDAEFLFDLKFDSEIYKLEREFS